VTGKKKHPATLARESNEKLEELKAFVHPQPRSGRGIRQESSRNGESENPDNPFKKFS
jgi:hypothetical protein